MTLSNREPQPLAVVNARVAAELRGLQDRVERLEDTLEVLYQNPAVKLDAHSIGTLQDIDFLRQSIAALSAYLEQLSVTASTDGTVCVDDALSAVPLRDMAARLRGFDETPARPIHAELF
ncbi:chemotaxis protein [Primorskyibacter sp. 2E233]|uniref:chemotaxis protein n=1 Tax=Primorskyibacter sp. 2E233 TaxID=3413431 RepID=UPI003BF19652